MDFSKLTIKKFHQGLNKKTFSCQEIVKLYFDQIKLHNPNLNAFINLNQEESVHQAEMIDKKIKEKKEIGLIEGVPMAIKDNIVTKNLITTAGSRILQNYTPAFNATVIEKLKTQRALILGKTNLDEFAMGSSNETSWFGPVKNPLDTQRVPGGSSGGSAVAVASQMSLIALGSDTGGSVRQPAAFCGLYGFKPTYGRISRYGLISMASSLDQIGILSQNLEDMEIIFDAIQGYDLKDATSLNEEQIKPLERKINKKKTDLVIGVLGDSFMTNLDIGVKNNFKRSLRELQKLNYKIIEVKLPHLEYALACYYLIMPAEVSSNLARYDGMRYGYSSVNDPKVKSTNLEQVYFKTREKGFGSEVKRRIILGTYILSAGYRDAYYLQAQKIRTLIQRDFEQAFENVDLIATPTTATPAFKLGEKMNDPLQMYLSDIYTCPVNLAGLPALSIPNGQAENLPTGLQIIGSAMGEKRIFDLARIYSANK
ncbi:MAG: Asp-tRNA(Asn)/Glu-tRNA(Gln) amidotransferase subunit GatA [Patescibacteria group bacterium]|nr:Asp-tRNA(Asn)/Glu-tRNA(Gln) amidotransferase subunit GatA [Patescibacteria group bacterium]